jgi:hypothetical protein
MSFAYYQQYFNVDTRHVLLRMSNTLIPVNPPDFLIARGWHGVTSTADDYTQEQQRTQFEAAGVVLNSKPDLYGPFWITTTLWMTLAIVSNIMSKIAFERQQEAVISGTPMPAATWAYNFSMASVACVLMYVYCAGMGLVVWGIMRWKNVEVSFIETLCLYGYSMFIFFLVAILCMIPVSSFQWLIVIVGGAWSCLYLFVNFWQLWKASLERSWFFFVVILVGAAHMAITMSFKFYFLNYDL